MKDIKINVRNIDEKFKEGLESTVYYYNDKELYDTPVLYKRYKSIEYIKDYYGDISNNIFENKHNKLLMISNLNCFKDEVKILDSGFEKNKFSG